jgi:alpha-D-xyloside xylohydrolase
MYEYIKKMGYDPAGNYPAGNFWSGKRISGGRLLRQCRFDTDKIGIYARTGSEIPIYPELVQHTGEMDLSKVTPLKFDHNYRGAADTFTFL